MNRRILVSAEAWNIISRDGIRFYSSSPRSNLDIFFTTRRGSDEGTDHGLQVAELLFRIRKNTPLVTMKQTHSEKVIKVSAPGEINADGCFSLQSNLALSVRVADCVPVFIYSESDTLTGVAHAGWRGTLSKIALRLVEKIDSQTGIPPHHLTYVLGPSIGACCYKVGDELHQDFLKKWPEAERFFSRRREGLFLDLRAANRFLFSSVGVKEGNSLNLCTSCERRRFYSFRREGSAGRNWGIIVGGK